MTRDATLSDVFRLGVTCIALACASCSADNVDRSVTPPRLESAESGGESPLLVVGKEPFLILGGELGNSATAGDAALASVWPNVRALNVNTVLAPAFWERIEPAEGRFDFSLLDGLLRQARENHVRVVLLWFGAYKNSMSTYVPAWVKRDPTRFPRAEDLRGRRLDILTPFGKETLAADCRAFAALMRHLREVDGDRQTVLMVQVENEIGMLPDASDYSPLARGAWDESVPDALMRAIAESDPGRSRAARLWADRNRPASGSWADVFGDSPDAREVFIAWHYARFVDGLCAAGKAEYPLPMFVNAALNRPGRQPGQYPSGGPLPHLLDVWRAGAPRLDMLSPDVYFFDFPEWTRPYAELPGNPLFVPETMRTPVATANAFVAIGRQRAIGFSPFAIESDEKPTDPLLGEAYGLLGQLMGEVTAAQASRRSFAVAPVARFDGTVDAGPQTIGLPGGYTLTATFDVPAPATTGPVSTEDGDPGARGRHLPSAGALIYATGDGAYTAIGTGVKLTHAAAGASVGLLDVDEWTCRDGRWSHFRWLNGDETNQGREVHLYPGRLKMQRVRLYKY